MKILITGASGFIGRNLCARLRERGYTELLEYSRSSGQDALLRYAHDCGFVFHLAGINRPADSEAFAESPSFTAELLHSLHEAGNASPVLFASSAQAALNNAYGRSKLQAEELVFAHGAQMGTDVYVYRLPGVFGKWCRPNYNSVVATFCDAAAHGRPLCVYDADAPLTLAHIDDVTQEMIRALTGHANRQGAFCALSRTFETTVGEVARRIVSFWTGRPNCAVPDMDDPLTLRLYSTYLSYLPEDGFSYPLAPHKDDRGLFTEFLKSPSGGQVSVNISRPGVTKGNHYHHLKAEKILVISGEGVIRLQSLGGGPVLEYPVCGEHPSVVEIPPGYVHKVENTGGGDMAMVIWANQIFDAERPDTYAAQIQR